MKTSEVNIGDCVESEANQRFFYRVLHKTKNGWITIRPTEPSFADLRYKVRAKILKLCISQRRNL